MAELTRGHGSHPSLEVIGAQYLDITGQVRRVYGDAVILTTGGFAADKSTMIMRSMRKQLHPYVTCRANANPCVGSTSLIREYAPELLHLATTNGDFAQGEGVKIARALGAALVDMDKIQIHPTGFVDPNDPMATPKILAPEALRGLGEEAFVC